MFAGKGNRKVLRVETAELIPLVSDESSGQGHGVGPLIEVPHSSLLVSSGVHGGMRVPSDGT